MSKANDPLTTILQILHLVKEDDEKLQRILTFLQEEFYEEEEELLPEQYNKVVQEIAGNIDAGLVCYLNLDTLEIKECIREMLDDPEMYAEDYGLTPEEVESKHDQWEHCVEFEPLQSFESFKIMEQFVDNVKNVKLKYQLERALNNRRPFAHFKNLIDSSDYRQDWFDFKQKWLESYVNNLLLVELKK